MMTNLKFLDFWFQGAEGYIEVRLIGKEGVKDRYFIAVNDLNEDLIQQINKQAYGEKLNVFFGVATRKQYGKGTEEDIQDVPGLWVDIDPKHASMSDAIQTVSQLPTPPTAIVSSGNGIHAYFKFEKPFRISDKEAFERIKELSFQMHLFTNADNTGDLPRLLRVPGSWNMKDPSCPKASKIIEYNDCKYSLDDFSYLSGVKINSSVSAIKKVKIDDFQPIELHELKVPPYVKKLIFEGAEEGKRSDKIFAVTCSMIENEHSLEEIAFVLTNPDWGISEKILGRPDQHQMPYIERVIENAIERVKSGESSQELYNVENVVTEIQVKNGCYYKGDKRLSNFVFEPSERILLKDNEILKGEIILQEGLKFTVIFDNKSLIRKSDFLAAINSSKVSWLGNDIDIQHLRELLSTKSVIEKRGVNKIGLHENLFITHDRIVNDQGEVNDSPLVYVPKFISNPTDLERSIKINMVDDWKLLAKDIMTLLPKINNEEVTYSMIGWHFVSPIAPLIRKLADGGFPQLMVWGTKGSGKTSTAQVFGKLFGNKEIRSCCRPPFSILREMDSLNAIPLYLDEYRPMNMPRDYLDQIKGFALNAYKAAYDSRGLQNQGTVDYQYTAPIVWVGETSFEDSNLMDRIVMTKLTPNAFITSQDYKKRYLELNKLELPAFLGGYVQWLLGKLKSKELDIAELYRKHKDYIDNSYKLSLLSERMSINIAIILVGLSIFQSLAGELGIDVLIPYDNVMNYQVIQLVGEDSKSSLDRLIEHTATMIGSNKDFRNGVDYLFDKNTGELILATTSWFAELRKFCREYNYSSDVVTDKQFRNFLNENCEVNGYVIISCSAKRKLTTQKRCTILNAYHLEKKLGIPLDTWI